MFFRCRRCCQWSSQTAPPYRSGEPEGLVLKYHADELLLASVFIEQNLPPGTWLFLHRLLLPTIRFYLSFLSQITLYMNFPEIARGNAKNRGGVWPPPHFYEPITSPACSPPGLPSLPAADGCRAAGPGSAGTDPPPGEKDRHQIFLILILLIDRLQRLPEGGVVPLLRVSQSSTILLCSLISSAIINQPFPYIFLSERKIFTWTAPISVLLRGHRFVSHGNLLFPLLRRAFLSPWWCVVVASLTGSASGLRSTAFPS